MQIFSIFWNNEQIAIQDLSPLTGPIELLITGYATARTIEAIALQASATPNTELFTLYVLPHTWIELSAYALATTEAIYLISSVLRGGFDWNRLERELRYVPTVLVMMALILAVAATFEVLEIHVRGYAELLFWIPTFLGVFLLVLTISRRPVSPLSTVAIPSGVPAVPPSGVEGIRRDIESRVSTDRPTSTAWLVLPAIQIVLQYSVIIFVFYSAFRALTQILKDLPLTQVQLLPFGQPYYTLVSYLVLAGLMAFLYHLIQRRNEHFTREHAWRTSSGSWRYGRRASRTGSMSSERGSCPRRGLWKRLGARRPGRDPMVWSVSTFFVGVLILFVYYFLMKDFFRHEEREDRFLRQLSFVASAIGVSLSLPSRVTPLPNRSFAVYAVLTVVTFYAYWMYWNYRLILDQNRHLVSEWDLEDGLLTSIEGNLARGELDGFLSAPLNDTANTVTLHSSRHHTGLRSSLTISASGPPRCMNYLYATCLR